MISPFFPWKSCKSNKEVEKESENSIFSETERQITHKFQIMWNHCQPQLKSGRVQRESEKFEKSENLVRAELKFQQNTLSAEKETHPEMQKPLSTHVLV